MKVKSRKKAMIIRANIVMIVILLVFAYATSYLVKWQVLDGDYYSTLTINQSLSTTELSASRGTIYDATGTKILAQSVSAWTVAIYPNYFTDDGEADGKSWTVANGLAEILDMDAQTIFDKTQLNSYFTYVKKQIDTTTKDEILEFLTENGINSGVALLEDYTRYYPYSTTASAVIGFTGSDGTGLYGIEYQYDDELTGTVGTLVSAQNALGDEIPFQYEQYVEAEDGYDLVLTIDETVQSICEKYLADGIEKYDVQNSGAVIVMNVNTGAIVAMATGEQYDLNSPWTIVNEETIAEIEALPEDEQSAATSTALYAQWRNKAISDTYEPGSVFKDITASAAIDSGVITQYTTFNCTGSYTPFEGVDPINCWVGSYGGYHGVQTVAEAICNSCNPFFMQAAEAMGATVFFEYFEAFGFTEKTGIDLPGEANSIYYEADELNAVELATASFGQGNTVTPIQMITAVAAVANGGYLVQPHVVDTVIDSDGNIVSTSDDTYKRQVISEETSELITEILEENATTGTAKTGYVEGYQICGKTGTSQKISLYNQDSSSGMQYIVSYCGYAPADDPEYAVLVFFDEPDQATASGGSQAGPVFASIMAEILPYLGVEVDYSDSTYLDSRVEAPSVIGLTVSQAQEILEYEGLDCEVFGDAGNDDVVVMQVPSEGSDMPDDGTVVLYSTVIVETEDLVTVPDFTGYSKSDCEYLASVNDLQVIFSGSSTSSQVTAGSQNILSGEKVKVGTVITVSLIDTSGLE
ncbi:MAG: penicillin-binding transpeptidase domain-containing protein [Clostridia bacterium]